MNNQTIFMSNLKGRIIQVLRKVKKGLPKYLVKYSSDYNNTEKKRMLIFYQPIRHKLGYTCTYF